MLSPFISFISFYLYIVSDEEWIFIGSQGRQRSLHLYRFVAKRERERERQRKKKNKKEKRKRKRKKNKNKKEKEKEREREGKNAFSSLFLVLCYKNRNKES
jgi:hypothetical protein